MKNILPAVARLAVGLWTGAVAAIAFAVAPRVFGFLDDPERAGELMAPIFRKVDLFGVVAAALFAVAARRSRWRFVLALALGALAAANAFVLSPLISERGENLRLFHGMSEAFWGVILVGGAVLALAGPTRRSD